MYTKIIDYNYIDNGTKKLSDSIIYRCRFCGEIKHKEGFKNKAHAVSECIGNKTLVTGYECDKCNEMFSRNEEQELANLFHLYRSTRSKKKKKGRTKLMHGVDINKSENEFKIKVDNPKDRNKSVFYELCSDGTAKVHITNNVKVNLKLVYRCLLKYALSVIPEELMPCMEKGYKMLRNEIPTKVDLCYLIVMKEEIKNQTIKVYKLDSSSLPKYFCVIDVYQYKYVIFLDFENEINFLPEDIWLKDLDLDDCKIYKACWLDYSSDNENIVQKEVVKGIIKNT